MADRSTSTPDESGAESDDPTTSGESTTSDDPTSESDPSFVHAATLRFRYPSRDRSRAVTNALAPEIGGVDDPRSRAFLDRDGETVIVRVRARDLVALRAGTNSWVRLVDVAESAAEAAATGRSRVRSDE
ncbi:KEOPS complex Pcc1-like subunit [haloarchaeon 3A1-DGR]|nr:KEOPS complex Pcc1-like subunit [haloarchaeon 3A1-DGR]